MLQACRQYFKLKEFDFGNLWPFHRKLRKLEVFYQEKMVAFFNRKAEKCLTFFTIFAKKAMNLKRSPNMQYMVWEHFTFATHFTSYIQKFLISFSFFFFFFFFLLFFFFFIFLFFFLFFFSLRPFSFQAEDRQDVKTKHVLF